jgi:hypothetical protein
VSILANLFGLLFLDILFGSITSRRSSNAAKRLFAKQGHVSSSIRAVEGRVVDIGTEWSVGVAEVRPGHLSFVPRIGIVGNREIDVLDLHVGSLSMKDVPVSASPAQVVVVTTPCGKLYWLVPIDLVDEIVDRLHPTDPQGAVA